MSRKSPIKIRKKCGHSKIKIRYLAVAVALVAMAIPRSIVQAASCPDVRVVFARGSGGAQNTDNNYLTFKKSIEQKIATTTLSYDFVDLDYPAVPVGMDNLLVTLGALIGAGEAYTFGRSVENGSNKLVEMVNSTACPGTHYVLGGYSQGAIVISKSLPRLDSSRIIYAATFGDPKLYLPEGKGAYPDACRGQNLSDYRMYVPDCQTYQGILGGYIPYEPSAYAGKLGTWCNKHDFFCSPYRNLSKHSAYIADNLYEDASRVIFDKISKYYNLNSRVASPHDTAIVIDSTGSMRGLINKYKSEALRLTKETLDSGGRVALYDYRDLNDNYVPKEHCNFLTCDLETVENALDNLEVGGGGGDTPESLLSTSFHVMKNLQWKFGATKSLVVLTDANFLSPDRDGMTFDKVVELSRTIDPVNFYIITTPALGYTYKNLAEQTGGKVVTNWDELSLLTDYIMERYDSLPRVEETLPENLPSLTVKSIEQVDSGKTQVKFETTGTETMVILNDAILGITAETDITISDLSPDSENILTLVPLTSDLRGESVPVDLGENYHADLTLLPKAPNTGRH